MTVVDQTPLFEKIFWLKRRRRGPFEAEIPVRVKAFRLIAKTEFRYRATGAFAMPVVSRG